MPIPEVGKLNPQSGDAQKKAAISSCIATEVKAGRPQDQAVAMCMEMVNKATRTATKPAAPESGTV
jgi:hypothetical protein